MLDSSEIKPPPFVRPASPLKAVLLPLVAIGFAVAIFAVDTFTPLGLAVAALYALVVVMSGRFLLRRGVVIVAAVCAGLTILSYTVQHGDSVGPALVRCLVSLIAIAVTTFLALKSQAADLKLREQAGLLEISHDAVVVRDMNDVVTYWNRGAEELYGCSRDVARGRLSHELLRTTFPQPLEEIKAELLRTGRWDGELRQKRCDDDTELTVASRWSLQRDERGRPAAMLETSNDITERKRAENALQRAQAELAHVTRVTTLGELTASIAHEVNQPLAAIVTNGEATLRWLRLDPPEIDEARGALDRIIRDSHRASEVIKRLRQLTKKTDTQIGPVDIAGVIDDVVALVQREVLSHQVRLALDLDKTLPRVAGDRVQLQQVLINLIVNGIEAMESVEPRHRQLAIRTTPHDSSRILVAVADTGIGLDADQLDHLCQAFITTKPDGMGMGLSICRSIIEVHGGKLWASSNNGPGATFYFTLPAHEGALS